MAAAQAHSTRRRSRCPGAGFWLVDGFSEIDVTFWLTLHVVLIRDSNRPDSTVSDDSGFYRTQAPVYTP
jgi:hypothetical protein